jgi:hypothetical protein
MRQHDFTAIPREPWVYWIPNDLRQLFETLPALGDVAQPRQGLATANNFRFLRSWWEVGNGRIAFDCQDSEEAQTTGRRWFPYMKGGGYQKWYGNQTHVVNWEDDGEEIKEGIIGRYPYLKGNWEWVAKNTEYYLREGVTYSYLTSAAFSARYSPGGFIFDVAGSSLFPENIKLILSVMNSPYAGYALKLVNPTVNFQVGDVARLPVVREISALLESLTEQAIRYSQMLETQKETTYDFLAPPCWFTGLNNLVAVKARLADLESQIDDEVYRLYGISDADRAAIEAELAGEPLPTDEEEIEAILDGDEDEEIEPPMDEEELAVRWISYAVGVVLGRFKVGAIDDLRLTIDETSADETEIVNRKSKIVNRPIGNAVYRREDFAVGSLPAPSEGEFDELVGPPERFAYVDDAGGRHVFPAEVEAALRDLALPDGIAVLDEGHPRDLPALVEQALRLMLDFRLTIDDLRLDREGEGDLVNRKSQIANRPSEEVIRIGAGGDLRKFLERDFFTKWHVKWYSVSRRKAPVYWPLQSARRSYGFYIFHEKLEGTTLYTLQLDYLDYKLNGLRQQIGDLTAQLEGLEGSRRKRVARDVESLGETLAEIEAFAKSMARIVREGYEPAPDWIDDGVILRMAPLWELIPIWKSEPKKYWGRLQKGEYDWSHIALHYWPERVREACRANKSYAIAHGHEEWYAGE